MSFRIKGPHIPSAQLENPGYPLARRARPV
jgi:hypothetical protein